MEKQKEKCIHEGHRQRLTETVGKSGVEGLSEVQLLEYVLFYIFPRGDTNPLSHRLLDRFGNFSNVLDADVEDLKQVKGMAETSAIKLTSLVQIFNRYNTQKVLQRHSIDTTEELLDYFEENYRPKSAEEVHAIAFDAGRSIITDRCLATGSFGAVQTSLIPITMLVASTNAAFLIFLHNHPGGSCNPSPQDRKTHELLKDLMKHLYPCQMLDDVIVGADGIYSLVADQTVRIYNREDYDFSSF